MKRNILAIGLMLMAVQVSAAPVTYVIDGNHTLPRFSYSHFGYSTQLSRFERLQERLS